MVASHKRKIVLLGMMTKMPVAGVIWQTMHYLVGLERLGYEVYYVEAHARTPSMLMRAETDDSSAQAAGFIDDVMRRFGLPDRWAFHALHSDGQCYGMTWEALRQLYRSAALIINLHGGTLPMPEHTAGNRLVYLETDPVQTQIELHEGNGVTADFLAQHAAHFSFGENFGSPDCRVPQSPRFRFRPTRQPVVLDYWHPGYANPGVHWTTVGNWRQQWRSVTFEGDVYTWSKHSEFLKFLDLPRRVQASFELALSSSSLVDQDRSLLCQHGWRLCDSLSFSSDPDAYRDYIGNSRGEFTVAKDQNVRLRSGWFSDRSATYLAAGRPVITQDTGFCNILPTGRGLLSFSTMDEIVAALECILSDYPAHCRAAREIAQDYFCHRVVLKQLLSELDL